MKAVRLETDRPSSSERSNSCCQTEWDSVIEIRFGFRCTTANRGGLLLATACMLVSLSRQMDPHSRR